MPDDPEDIVDIAGVHYPRPPVKDEQASSDRRPWKMVLFECCRVYGRITRNAERTKYLGRCPKCGTEVYALIGPEGTSRRIFRAK